MCHKELFHWEISKDSIKSKITQKSPKVHKIENCPVEIIILPRTTFLTKIVFAQDKFLPKTKNPKMENLPKTKKTDS